jgi:hypothetical protein
MNRGMADEGGRGLAREYYGGSSYDFTLLVITIIKLKMTTCKACRMHGEVRNAYRFAVAQHVFKIVVVDSEDVAFIDLVLDRI